jgi:ribosomal protein S12 methylthiotransferase
MRGEHRSRSIEDLVAETKLQVSRGVKEVLLIAQELTYYGLDLYKKRMLPQLLDSLAQIKGLGWIRLHYAYPSKFPREVFQVMADHENICNYIDMPLQHADDAVLHRMKRQISQEETKDLIVHARSAVPNLTFRTTMLVGFPGETVAEFESLYQFVEDMQFDRLGVFEYSHEDGTTGATLPDDVPKLEKEFRAGALMELQRGISLKHNEAKIGSIQKVLVDRKEGPNFYGRTEADSPEVDNEVIIDASLKYARVGDFVNVKITDATEYDLYGEII